MSAVAIVDYGMGNLRSLANALRAVGAEPELVEAPERLSEYDRAVLPGVGAFGASMRNLRSVGYDQAIREYVASGRPLLGICLGFQVLFERGTEGGDHEGLGLVPGRVRRFETSLHVPHVGWNAVRTQGHTLWDGLGEAPHMYFVHSYHADDVGADDVIGVTDYGERFVSAVARGNVAGTQFHPEKSGPDGLRVLHNFVRWQVSWRGGEA